MWRAIVVVGSIAVTVTTAAGVAHAVPAPDDRALAAGRGLLVAATAAASLLGSAWAMRRGFVAAGIPADESLVPSQAPEALRKTGERLGRSPGPAVAGALALGLVLGLVGGRLGSPGAGGIFDRETIEFASGTDDPEDGARGERVAGARSEAAQGDEDATGNGESGPGESSAGSEGQSGGDTPKADSPGTDDSNTDSGEKPKKATGTTTTTVPKGKSPVGVVCEALDDYSGDVDALLAAVGLGSTSQMTEQACDDIEDILANPVDEIEKIIDDLVGQLPVTTTTITVPITVPQVTTTIPLVPTTTITLPPLTVPTVPKLF